MRNSIQVEWHIEDVRLRAELFGLKLTDDELRAILHGILNNHDATIGINWDVIDFAILASREV